MFAVPKKAEVSVIEKSGKTREHYNFLKSLSIHTNTVSKKNGESSQ